jgi:hypothetical protein
VLVFYARQLELPAAAIGVIVAVAGIGGIVGSLGAGPLARRVGDARLLWISTIVTTPLLLLVPLGRPGGWLALPVIGVIGANAAIAAFNVCVRAALQRNVPPDLLGRVTASIRVLSRGALPWVRWSAGRWPRPRLHGSRCSRCSRVSSRCLYSYGARRSAGPYARRSGHPHRLRRSGHIVT